MRLQVIIPKTTFQKRVFNSVECVVSTPQKGCETFTFRDLSVSNIYSTLCELKLPVVLSKDYNDTNFFQKNGKIDDSSLTFIYDQDTSVSISVFNKYIIKEQIADSFAVVSNSKRDEYEELPMYTLYNEDIIIRIYRYLKASFKYSSGITGITDNLEEILDSDTILNFSYSSVDDFKHNVPSIASIMANVTAIRTTKKPVHLDSVDLMPKTVHATICYPAIVKINSCYMAYNRILNKTKDYKFRGITKLDSAGKLANISSRLVKLYSNCRPAIERNFDKYCCGIKSWYSIDSDMSMNYLCDRATQITNPSIGVNWANSSKSTGPILNKYKGFSLLEKYLLSLDPLPIELDPSADTKYAQYAKDMLTLFAYSEYLRLEMYWKKSRFKSHVRKEQFSNSIEEIPFYRQEVRIPEALHKSIIKNIKSQTAESSIFPSPVVSTKINNTFNLTLESSLNIDEKDLCDKILAEIDDFSKVEQIIDGLIKAP